MLSGLVLYQAPNFIIGKMISAAAVTLYAAGALISMTIREIVGALASVLMPMFSQSDALDDRQALETRLWQGSLLGNAVSWMIVVGVLMYGEPLVVQWLGQEKLGSYWPLVIMVAGEASAGFDSAAASALAGYGHLKWLMLTRVFGAVLSLILAVVIVEWSEAGIIGVALAVTVPNTIRGYWLAWYCNRKLNLPFWRFLWRSTARPLAASGLLAGLCLLLAHVYPVTSRGSLLVTVAGLAIAAGVIGVAVAIPPTMRRKLTGGLLTRFEMKAT
jgi:O-antigen/teichoic acid export membrane protein